MRTAGFEAPTSLEEALELRGRHGTDCRVLAGGTDLLVRAKTTGEWPAYIVDAKRVPEMTRIAVKLMLPLKQSGNVVEQPIDVEAVVVRREELPSNCSNESRFRLALFFTKMDPDVRGHLSDFLGE